MTLTIKQKEQFKQDLIASLSHEKEVKKIIIFGSFLTSNAPNDLDVAVLQDSPDAYLPLSIKYRRKTRKLAGRIPLDIIPIKTENKDNLIISEILKGETIYER